MTRLLAFLIRSLTSWLQRPDPRIPPSLRVITPQDWRRSFQGSTQRNINGRETAQ